VGMPMDPEPIPPPQSRKAPSHGVRSGRSNIDSTMDNISTSTESDSYPDQGPSSDRLLFDFEGFLEGGALDDILGIPQLDPTPTPTPILKGGKWEITKLSGGLINVTVRVIPRDELGRSDPRSVVIKHAPPFVAAMGECAPFGTFRQASTPSPPPRHRDPRAAMGSSES